MVGVVVAALVFFGTFPLIRLAHEAAYASVARLLGARVESVQVGLGPRVVRRGAWDVRAFPFMAVVKLASPSPLRARLLGSIAALFAGYLGLCVPAFAIGLCGWPRVVNTTEVSMVSEDSPASAAGMQEGDRVVAVDGHPVRYLDDVRARVAAADEGAIEVEVQRDGRRERMRVVPYEEDGRRLLGFASRVRTVFEPRSVGEAALGALETPFNLWRLEITMWVDAFTRSDPDGVQSAVGMMRLAYDPGAETFTPVMIALQLAIRYGGLFWLLHFVVPIRGFAPYRVFRQR